LCRFAGSGNAGECGQCRVIEPEIAALELGHITGLVNEVTHHILMQLVDAEGLGEAPHFAAKAGQRLGIGAFGSAEGIRADAIAQQVEGNRTRRVNTSITAMML